MSRTKVRQSTPIVLNGEPAATGATTLAGLLAEQGYAHVKVATALNGAFVPERARAAQAITPGDRIEVVSARQGG